MDEEIKILLNGKVIFRAVACIASPAEGVQQQGLIRMMGGGGGQQGKHVLYLLAQRALLDFEEKTLEPLHVSASTQLEIHAGAKPLTLTNGAVLAMDSENGVRFWLHEGLEIRPILVAFHRMATRMIRLDVP